MISKAGEVFISWYSGMQCWDQKRDRYEEGNKNNIQGLEGVPARETDSHIFQILSLLWLRTFLEVHAGISPGVQVGTLTGFERQQLIPDGEHVGNGR